MRDTYSTGVGQVWVKLKGCWPDCSTAAISSAQEELYDGGGCGTNGWNNCGGCGTGCGPCESSSCDELTCPIVTVGELVWFPINKTSSPDDEEEIVGEGSGFTRK